VGQTKGNQTMKKADTMTIAKSKNDLDLILNGFLRNKSSPTINKG
jgi:hypothetical protein